MIILPDGFKTPEDIAWTNKANNWTTNTYTAEQWATLEALGAVFLPASGYRNIAALSRVQSGGGYWSNSYGNDKQAYGLYFSSNYLNPQNCINRYYGYSVRLVQDYN